MSDETQKRGSAHNQMFYSLSQNGGLIFLSAAGEEESGGEFSEDEDYDKETSEDLRKARILLHKGKRERTVALIKMNTLTVEPYTNPLRRTVNAVRLVNNPP